MSSIYYQRTFVPGCYYHIYNRGANQQLLYKDKKDYLAFTAILKYYLVNPQGIPPSTLNRQPKNKVTNLVKGPPSYTLLAYCLMPNHFHFMLRQEEGEVIISNLMRRISITYAMYFNDRYHHSGTIFQGRYKNVLVTNESQWIYLSKYIHRNPLHLQSYEPCKLVDYQYSSYPDYMGIRHTNWIDTDTIMDRYPTSPIQHYSNFVEDGGDVGNIEKITLDVEEDQFLQGS